MYYQKFILLTALFLSVNAYADPIDIVGMDDQSTENDESLSNNTLPINNISPSNTKTTMPLTPKEELVFKTENDVETVYDKNGNLFVGAVILTDDEGRNTTYFYRQGHRNGVSVARYEDGKIEVQTTYRKGLKDGTEVMFFENGNPKYKKTYKNNKLNGEEVIYYENGKPQRQNHYHNGLLNGEVNYFDEAGNLIKIEHYKNGIKDGIEHIIENNRLREEYNYVNGKLEGISKKYNEQHMTDEVMYVNNKKEGLAKQYLADGTTIEIPYENDQKNGVAHAYYPDRQILNRVHYVRDRKNGLSEKFYKNGNRQSAETYKNDTPEGIQRIFSNQGKLLKVNYYINGLEFAKINIENNRQLHDIANAVRLGQLSQYTAKKNLWYPVLWYALNTENKSALQVLEKDMNMYAFKLDDTAVYQRESKSAYTDYNRNLFFGLTPLSYAVNLSSPVEILQKFATPEHINEINPRGGTALLEAIRLNNSDMVKFLLLRGADTSIGSANILLDAMNENAGLEIIEELLKVGVDINKRNSEGLSPLFIAVRNNDSRLVKLLLKYQADVKPLYADGKNILFYAITANADEQIVEALINAGAQINIDDASGNNMLISALSRNNVSLVSKLLRAGADVNHTDAGGESAATYVLYNPVDEAIISQIYEKNIDVINKVGKQQRPLWQQLVQQNRPGLLKKVFDRMGGVDKPDANGEIPVNAIISNIDNTDFVNVVLSYINMDWLNSHPQYIWQVLEAQNLELWQKLVNIGFDKSIKNNKGEIIITYVIKNKLSPEWLTAVSSLNPNWNEADDSGATPLSLAIEQNNIDLVKMLLELGAEINPKSNSYLPLLTTNQAEMTALLLSSGADITFISPENKTLVMSAVEQLNKELLEFLLNNNADINMRDNESNTSIFYLPKAIKKYSDMPQEEFLIKFKDVLKLLLDTGADINERDGNGSTLLILSAQAGSPYYPQILAILTELGANPDIKDQYGKTASDYAK